MSDPAADPTADPAPADAAPAAEPTPPADPAPAEPTPPAAPAPAPEAADPAPAEPTPPAAPASAAEPTPPAPAPAAGSVPNAPPTSAPVSPPAAAAGPAPAPPRGGSGGLALRLALVLLSPVLAVLVVAALPRKLDLWVVNGSALPMVVQVQDRELEMRPRSAQLLSDLRAGQLTLRWREGQDAVRETTVRLESELFAPRPTWVWDAGAHARRFWIVSRGYGDHVAPPPEAVAVDGLWRFPADVLPEVDRPLPEQIAAPSQGASGAVRRTLWTDFHAQSQRPARVRLLVDNHATVPAQLRVDGLDAGQVAAQSVLRVEDLAPGPHVLELTALPPGGGMGQTVRCEATLEAEPLGLPAGWVWRPWGGEDYWVVVQGLGQVEEQLPPPERFTPPGELFRVPTGVEPGLDELPGRTLVRRDAKGVLLRSLWTTRGLSRALQQRGQAAPVKPRTLKDMLEQSRPEEGDEGH